jgi:hypothetical protein
VGSLVLFQGPFALPLLHGTDVAVPLLARVAEEVRKDVLPERVPDHLVALRGVEPLGGIGGELADAQPALLPFRHLEDVAVDRLATAAIAALLLRVSVLRVVMGAIVLSWLVVL